MAKAGQGFQDKLSAIFWVIAAALCVRLVWKASFPFSELISSVQNLCQKRYSIRSFCFKPVALLGTLLLMCSVVASVHAEILIGIENLTAGSARLDNTPEIQAARWIQSHAEPNAIVAARLTSLLYHYSGRKIVWFPPITDPRVLMQGLRQHQIQYVVVIDRDFNYYLPPDPVCFDALYKAYPQAFHLVEAKDHVKIYQLLPDYPAQPSTIG
jgi:hypothetical protein